MRTFVALEVPPDTRSELDRLQRRLIARLATDAVRWSPPDKMHLTLRFMGEVEAEKIGAITAALRLACVGQKAPRLALGELGCFPNIGKPSVIWLGVSGEIEKLNTLFARVDAALSPFAERPDAKEYNPHLTLGRVKATARNRARWLGEKLRHEILPAGQSEWMADRVVLFKSELTSKGSIYTALETVELVK